MIKIKKEKECVTVTSGAFHTIFEPLGWEKVETEIKEDSGKEKPITKMNKTELIQLAVSRGYDEASTSSATKEELITMLQE